MEITKVAEQIENRISVLKTLRRSLKEVAQKKAEAISEYERELSKTIISLKNGQKFMLDGKEIANPPATLIEKIARGICFQEKLNCDLAETNYKSVITSINAVMAELNGWQSIYRHLEEK